MSRRQWDESDVRIRPSRRGTRPRTKDRPAHDDAEFGMVVTKDRGRWGVVLDGREDPIVTMRAREMGRTAVEVGDLPDRRWAGPTLPRRRQRSLDRTGEWRTLHHPW